MILVIDNYDSFVYNLARYFGLTGQKYTVVRNNEISVDEIYTMDPDAIVISPGPCSPKEAGISVELIRKMGQSTPILGVCLGHQCIGEAYGGQTIRAAKPVHGKSSIIEHNGKDLFAGLPAALEVGRYHSLITKLPSETPLNITARTADGEIMAMQHKTHPVYGVQFHPESILTKHGLEMIWNFTSIAKTVRKNRKIAA